MISADGDRLIYEYEGDYEVDEGAGPILAFLRSRGVGYGLFAKVCAWLPRLSSGELLSQIVQH